MFCCSLLPVLTDLTAAELADQHLQPTPLSSSIRRLIIFVVYAYTRLGMTSLNRHSLFRDSAPDITVNYGYAPVN